MATGAQPVQVLITPFASVMGIPFPLRHRILCIVEYQERVVTPLDMVDAVGGWGAGR